MKQSLLALATTLLAFAGAAQASPATYGIDPTHTLVTFEALHFGTSTTRGRFDKKEGSVTIDRAAKTGKAEITIDLASVSTGVAPLDRELRGKDFFDTAAHPTARFVGDKFAFEGEKVVAVTGTLTLFGKTEPVTLKATRFNCYINPFVQREACGGDFEATLSRAAFGNRTLTEGGVIGDSVRLLVQIEAIKQ